MIRTLLLAASLLAVSAGAALATTDGVTEPKTFACEFIRTADKKVVRLEFTNDEGDNVQQLHVKGRPRWIVDPRPNRAKVFHTPDGTRTIWINESASFIGGGTAHLTQNGRQIALGYCGWGV